MADTLYATFSDSNRAKKAADDLLGLGIEEAEISLLIHRGEGVVDSQAGVDLEDTRPTTPMRGTEFFKGVDPTGDGIRQLSVPRMERGLDVEINPVPSASGEPIRSEDQDSARRKESLEATPHEDMPDSGNSLRFSRGYNGISETSPENIKIDPDADAYRDADMQLKPHANAHDVAKGAEACARIGFEVGAVAALISLLIPGVGLVIGGGALAAAAAALVAGTGIGVVSGGIVGVLKDQGIPEDTARRYMTALDGGGAILAVTVTKTAMRPDIEKLLEADGAKAVESHPAYLS